MTKTRKFIIKDWAGNLPYGNKEFDTSEDAWELIRSTHPDEEDWQEFYVDRVESELEDP